MRLPIAPFVCRTIAFVVLFASLGAARASASPLWFVDAFTPSDVFFASSGGACVGTNGSTTDTVSGKVGGKCDTLQFTLSLPGYNRATDTLIDAIVSLGFHDDSDSSSETLSIRLDSLNSGGFNISQNSTDSRPFIYSFYSPVEQLVTDGLVTLSLTQLTGDFWFDGAAVVATATRAGSDGGLSPVPEPASMVLVGAGLLGVVARFRRQARRGSLDSPPAA